MFILSSNTVLWSVLFAINGIFFGVAAALFVPIFGYKKAQKQVKKTIKDSETKAEQIVRNAQIEAKQAAFELKQEAEKEIKEKKKEITVLEDKLLKREQGIDRRDITLQGKETLLDQKN